MRRAGVKATGQNEVDRAAAILGISVEALEVLDEDRLRAAYQLRVRNSHPDVNNADFKPVDMAELRWAKDRLVRFLKSLTATSRQCPTCFGNKTITIAGSFRAVKCPKCGGKGEISANLS